MEIFKGKSENEKNLKNLYDEILRLSDQINSVKEKIEKEYPLVDSLGKMKIEIEELKKKTTELKEYKSYAEGISNQIEDFKKKKENHSKWQFYLSLIVVLVFLVFGTACTWKLLLSSVVSKEPYSFIALLTAGVLGLVIMAIVLVFFVNECRRLDTVK